MSRIIIIRVHMLGNESMGSSEILFNTLREKNADLNITNNTEGQLYMAKELPWHVGNSNHPNSDTRSL